MATESNRRTVEGFFGTLDYANVTEFRESLLKSMTALEENPSRQYLVTRHGKPVAVFMSAKTFESLKALVTDMLRKEDLKPTEQVLHEAKKRMDRDHGVAAAPIQIEIGATAPAVSAQIDLIKEQVTRLQDLLQSIK